MGIALGATRVNGLFVGGNTISKASMGADSNKIWPEEILYEGSGSGAIKETFDVPSGFTVLEYYIEMMGGDVATVVLDNNGNTIIDQSIMSDILEDSVTVSSGSIDLFISTLDTGSEWNYTLVLR